LLLFAAPTPGPVVLVVFIAAPLPRGPPRPLILVLIVPRRFPAGLPRPGLPLVLVGAGDGGRNRGHGRFARENRRARGALDVLAEDVLLDLEVLPALRTRD